MSTECVIIFDNVDSVYYTGTNVSGKVELVTIVSKQIKGILIQITGVANVCWNKNESVTKENDRNVIENIEYTNNETYLSDEKYVLGSKYSDYFELPPSSYTYTFNSDLPLDMPSSFIGKYGEIIYEVTLIIDRGDSNYSNKFKQAFTVLNSLDLNMNPEYQLPKSFKECENFSACSCICGRGNVEAEIQIPCNGFAAGQDIPFTIIISNDSTSDLYEGSKVHLERRVIYYSNEPEESLKSNEVILDTKVIGGVLRFTKKEFKNILEIPNTQPTTKQNLNCCIRITYTIIAQIITDWCADNIMLEIPITIGTTPLLAGNGSITMQPISPTAPSNWELEAVGSLRNLDLPPQYNTIGPPSYQSLKLFSEDFEMRRNNVHNRNPHIIKYPVFSNNTESAPPYEDDI